MGVEIEYGLVRRKAVVETARKIGMQEKIFTKEVQFRSPRASRLRGCPHVFRFENDSLNAPGESCLQNHQESCLNMARCLEKNRCKKKFGVAA